MTTPAGWYPDPSGAPSQPYWDGQRWTEHAAPGALPKRGMATSAKVAIGITVVAVLAVAGLHTYSQSVSADEPGSNRRSADQQSASGVVGSEVRDGKFAFVVESVERQTNWTGEPKPRGQWVIATVQVTNVGNEPQSFFVANQKLIDSAGREYAADGSAAIYMGQESMAIDLGPRLALTAQLPFDVPTGTTPATLVLHDSAFSGGVRVSI